MGYKVFGVRVQKETEKDIQYTTERAVQTYVQFQQWFKNAGLPDIRKKMT